MNKVISFLKKNNFEKKHSIVRNTYWIMNYHKFKNIGKKSYFWDPMFLSGTTHISMGNNVEIWQGARVEMITEWEGQKYSPQLVIGNNVNIGQNLHLTVASSVIIENGVLCTCNVTITDITHCTNEGELSVLKQGIISRPVRICENAFIGSGAVILPGVTIGKNAVIGANAVVTHDVPDFATAIGIPARIKKEV